MATVTGQKPGMMARTSRGPRRCHRASLLARQRARTLSIRTALPILISATTYEAMTDADLARLGCVGIPRQVQLKGKKQAVHLDAVTAPPEPVNPVSDS
jgi:hypothetical protein